MYLSYLFRNKFFLFQKVWEVNVYIAWLWFLYTELLNAIRVA